MCSSGRAASSRACLLELRLDLLQTRRFCPSSQTRSETYQDAIRSWSDASPVLTVLEPRYLTSAAKRASTTCIYCLLELSQKHPPSVRLSAASYPSSERTRKSLRRSRRSRDSSPRLRQNNSIGSKEVRPVHVRPLSRNTKSKHRTAHQFSPATRPPLVAESAKTIRISIAIPRQPAGQITRFCGRGIA